MTNKTPEQRIAELEEMIGIMTGVLDSMLTRIEGLEAFSRQQTKRLTEKLGRDYAFGNHHGLVR